jgi:competence protein ComEC
MKFALTLRKDITNKIDYYFKKDYAAILKPVVIGDKSSLSAELKNNFIDAGLMHVLVVSGLNVGFIGAIFLFIFKLLGLNLKTASTLTIPFIFLYVLATGANPPVFRAGVMFSCVLISLSLDREPLIYNSIAMSALIILLLQPQQLFTASFQMSYAATIGIIYFYKDIFSWFNRVKNKILRFLCAAFAVTLCAQILIIPVCMYYFGKISIISFAANIFVVPAMGILLYLSVIFYLFAFVCSYAAIFVSFIISIITHAVLELTIFFGSLSFASIDAPKPSALQTIFFFAFIFFITAFKGKKRFISGGILIFINFFYLTIPSLYDYSRMEVDIYGSKNITAIYVKDKEGCHFTLYQTGKYYDGYFIKAFKEFIKFKGIKKPDITAAGFKETKDLENDLKPLNMSFKSL